MHQLKKDCVLSSDAFILRQGDGLSKQKKEIFNSHLILCTRSYIVIQSAEEPFKYSISSIEKFTVVLYFVGKTSVIEQ